MSLSHSLFSIAVCSAMCAPSTLPPPSLFSMLMIPSADGAPSSSPRHLTGVVAGSSPVRSAGPALSVSYRPEVCSASLVRARSLSLSPPKSIHWFDEVSHHRYNPANEKTGIDETKINVHLIPRKFLIRPLSLRPFHRPSFDSSHHSSLFALLQTRMTILVGRWVASTTAGCSCQISHSLCFR